MPAQLLPLIWPSDPTRYAPARHRRACAYEAFVPAPLAELDVRIGGGTTGLVSDAEQAIHYLNASAQPGLAPLARLLLRTESIASSKVEGLQMSTGELARAEVRSEVGQKIGPTALHLLANIDAMQLAVDHATTPDPFSVPHICAIHAKLMSATPASARIAGRIREQQNWIGGNDYAPCGADFVPPPHEYLTDNIEAWIAHFAESAASAATLARGYLQRVERLSAEWHDMLRATDVAPRAGSAAWEVLKLLPGWPVITAPIATAASARAKVSVYEAIEQLVTAGVLLPLSSSPRKRAWEVYGMLELLAGLEEGRTPAKR